MTPPVAEPKATTAASPSQPSTPSDPKSTTPPGVTAPPMGVRQTPSTQNTATAPASFTGFGSDGAQPPSDPLDSPGSIPSSEPEQPAQRAPLSLKKRPLADVLRGLVLGATVVIHQTLARSEYEQAAGVWLMAEDEAAGVADPLANIANRHAGEALVNPDMGDLIAAGVAAASYVVSNAVKAFQIRRALRRGPHTEPDPEEQL